MRTWISLCLVACAFHVNAQKKKPVEYAPSFTPAEVRMKGLMQRETMDKNSVVNEIQYRNVGPAVMSGRVTDIEVNPQDATHFYVAYATGGLWETKNNGTTFTPIFDNQWVFGIGDIAVDWKSNVIYVGTGEQNSSRSSYAGNGIYRSSNNGKNWEYLGLGETHHISRIVLHPENPNVFWVAAIGHLFTPNKERGLYMTADGGKTFQQTLFVNENAGAIDLIVNPSNPNELYCSSWQRERRAWNFVESGAGSGIHKSTDGGKTWSLISGPQSGFPNGEGVGRIGLAQCKSKPNVVYAFLDNQFRRPETKKSESGDKLSKNMLKTMSKEEFLKLSDEKIAGFLSENGFPEKITVALVREKVSNGKLLPAALAEYLEDANSLLFDTPVIGAEIYRSDDGGKSWKKTHEGYMDDIVYTYGYYFGQIRVDDHNPDKVWLAAFVVAYSEDGGKKFKSINGDNVHVDHHALYINPAKEGHLINGNDGGVNISYDNGKNWIRCNQPNVGQFYTVNVDMAKPYNIYGGLQDNGVWWAPSTTSSGTGWQMEGQNPWKTILGGDGMQVQIDPRDNTTVYTGFQFGHYFRINKNTGESFYITPKHELGERPLRWNWQTPILLSPHSPDVLYMCANKVFRSLKKGEEFVAISEDLTKGGKPGDVAYGTITSVHESPMKFGLLYAGTDDGMIWVTKNGGTQWENINGNLPGDFWVRRIQASKFKEGRVYVCLNGHTRNDFSSLLYTSEDYGKTWQKIGLDLPMEPVNVVREDPENENLLYVGTDHGVYISLDRGKSFMSMQNGMPRVPVHDMVIHPRDHELVVATHGRSIYVANVRELQQLHDSIRNKMMHCFEIPSVKHSSNWGTKFSYWDEAWTPNLNIPFWYSGSPLNATLEVKDEKGTLLYSNAAALKKGLIYISYDLSINRKQDAEKAANDVAYLSVGTYTVTITYGSYRAEGKLEIKE